MVAIFLEELSELVEAFDDSTQQLIENPKNFEAIGNAERQLHTIKGGARMTGLFVIGDLSHAGESLLNLVANEKISADAVLLEKLQHVSDELFRMYESVAKNSDIEPATVLIEELQQLSEQNTTASDEIRKSTVNEIDKDISQESDTSEIVVVNVPVPKDVVEKVSKQKAVDLDPMMEIFLEELSELVEAFDESTQKLIDDPQDSEAIKDAERQLHTMKGGARMTGLLAIGDLTHAGESLLNEVANNKVQADDCLLSKLQEVSDTLYKMYQSAAAGDVVEVSNRLIDELNALSGQETIKSDDEEGEKDTSVDLLDKAVKTEGAISLGFNEKGSKKEALNSKVIAPAEVQQLQSVIDEPGCYKLPNYETADEYASELEKTLKSHAKELNSQIFKSLTLPSKTSATIDEKKDNSSIRVSTDVINQLITSSNEWGAQNIRLMEQYEESGGTTAELRRTANRLKEQIRNLELEADSSIHAGGPISSLPKIKGSFDPLEMDEYTELQQQSRSLSESLEDLMNLTDCLETDLKKVEAISIGQERIFKKIQEKLINTRMTKITGLLSRLKRIVRQVSSELGKTVSLKIADENGEMDRTILERITASLEHLIRNSLAHGIEKPSDRLKLGKSAEGIIRLRIEREGPEVVIILEDDGVGINVEKLRTLSIKKGLINENAILSDKEVYQLILMSGVSTADKVSQVAGRGVGMDVVNKEVNALGGNIVIDSKRGEFTRFELRVPYNLATNQLMFLEVSGEVLAVPVAKLEGMQRIQLTELNAAYARKIPMLEYSGRNYKLHHLGEILGLSKQHENIDVDKTLPVILLEGNGQYVAFQVDEIRGNREVMLKPLGALFESSKLLSTAAIQGNGQIVLVLNTHELINLGLNDKVMQPNVVSHAKTREKTKIMVVDDSITVRKITQKLLTSLGYSVVTANDGINALEVLVDESPNLMLLDIEMPRMDGFELLENMRGSEQWVDLPVIMISSRSGSKHRQYAQALGANGFIGKPWEVDRLVENIEACLNKNAEEGVLI